MISTELISVQITVFHNAKYSFTTIDEYIINTIAPIYNIYSNDSNPGSTSEIYPSNPTSLSSMKFIVTVDCSNFW